jgi:hypothetical protein
MTLSGSLEDILKGNKKPEKIRVFYCPGDDYSSEIV